MSPDQPDQELGQPRLPARPADGHKGTFGTVGVIGGCAANPVMIGAPVLCARAALRTGAGLAVIAAPEPILPAALGASLSATGIPLACDEDGVVIGHLASEAIDALSVKADALVVGPGLGGTSRQGPAQLAASVRAMAIRAIGQESAPVVVDADALNALSAIPDWRSDLRAPAVLTPHPGEFTRLAPTVGVNATPRTPEERLEACADMAARLGCVVVLKGHGTVVSDGHRTWACDRGGPELATGGTGDVLAGAIAGLCAQLPRGPLGEIDLFLAAQAGVLAHAIAGEMWKEHAGAESGLLAQELADLLPGAVGSLRERAG